MYAEHLVASAHLSDRRRHAARRAQAAEARRSRRPAAPRGARVALGQLLVRTGERLSGASPGPHHA